MKLIMENWIKFLNENNPIAKAVGKGLAISTQIRRGQGVVVVYDAQKIIDTFEFYKKHKPESISEPYMVIDILSRNIDVLAGVRFSKPRYNRGECNNSYEVTNSASKENSKLGPTAYEAALFYLNGLSPDRMVVKPGAEKVWSIYNKRADSEEVEKKPFDDLDSDQKQTPDDTSDDCLLHKGKDHLNYSYDIDSKPSGLKELEDNHVKVLITLSQLGVKQNTFLFRLSNIFDHLFTSRYS